MKSSVSGVGDFEPANRRGIFTRKMTQSSDFVPERVVVSLPASQIPYASQVYDVQVSGHATEEMSNLFRIIIVADHEAYLGDITRVGSSATVTLLLMSHKEADTVTSAIRKRYSLP